VVDRPGGEPSAVPQSAQIKIRTDGGHDVIQAQSAGPDARRIPWCQTFAQLPVGLLIANTLVVSRTEIRV
jgi:hypothetical protein